MSKRSSPNSAKTDPNASEGLRRLYGRRQAFKLRDRQAQLIEDLLPRLSIDADDLPALAEMFPDAREVWLEVGFGAGEHMVAQAQVNPDVGIIGAEPFLNGLAKALTKIDEEGLENIRLLPADARPLLEHLPDASLARAFLLFPDPWPKSRHHKRRFVQTWVLDELARVLKDGAEFRVASDIEGYVAWTLEKLIPHPAFEWAATCADDWRVRPDDWPGTRYEAKALKAGRVPAYLSFRRICRGNQPERAEK